MVAVSGVLFRLFRAVMARLFAFTILLTAEATELFVSTSLWAFTSACVRVLCGSVGQGSPFPHFFVVLNVRFTLLASIVSTRLM